MMIKRATLALALTAALAMAAAPASAATIYAWDGGTGAWNDDAHWSGTGVPGAGDTGVVNGGTITAAYETPFAGDLELKGGTLDFPEYTGTWSYVIGALYLQGGAVTWEDDSSTRHVTGPIYVQADTDISVSSVGKMTIDSALSGSGGITKKDTGLLIVTNPANSSLSGAWTVEAGTVQVQTLVTDDSLDSSEHLGSGSVSLASGARLFFYPTGNASVYLNNSVSGSGTVSVENSYSSSRQSDLYASGITLSPGDSTSAGTLHISNHSNDSCNVILADAVLSIGLGGATAGSYDQLETVLYNTKGTGDDLLLNSNVTLELASIGGFAPGAADEFVIVSNVSSGTAVAGAVGRFFNDNGAGHLTGAGWSADVDYAGGDGNDIVLSNVVFTPEPATVAFLAAGGLATAVGAVRRRRRG